MADSEGRVDNLEVPQQFFVRTQDDGLQISSIIDRRDSGLTWNPGKDFRAKGDANIVETKFILPTKPEIGTILDFDGRHYEVTEPLYPYLKKKYGENSVYVRFLKEPEYQALIAKKQA